ncbi:MAG: pseudouridine synthase [Pseudomonadota bacterium]
MDILYRDSDYVAVHKPAGLLVHRSPIDRHETEFALQRARDAVGQHVYPVHRLDKATSGVLLFALSPPAANAMMLTFARGGVAKRYLAIVRGYAPEAVTVDHAFVTLPDRIAEPQADPNPAPQPAVTHVVRLATVELPVAVSRYPTSRYSLVALNPEHGRKHQLRRHLKHIFHPIIGDTTHGEGRHNRMFRTRYQCHRLLLAATSLSFAQPLSGAAVTIEAAPEASFTAVAHALGWNRELSAELDAIP